MDRSKHIGSSDISAILGISPFKTALQLYEEKLGISEPEYNPEKEIRLKRGTRFEPLIIDQYAEEYGDEIVARNDRYTHPTYPFMAAEIDAEERYMDEETINLEIKSVSAWSSRSFGEQGTDDVPDYYAAQVTYGMLCSGRKQAKLVALIGTDDLRVYDIPYDEDLGNYLEQEAVNFWNNHILAKVPPMPRTREDAKLILNRVSGLNVTCNAAMRDTIEMLGDLKRQMGGLEKMKEGFEEKLLTEMAIAAQIGGSSEEDKFLFVDDNGRQLASWNRQDHTSIDQKRLKSEYPEIAAELTRKKKIRVFRLKGEK